MTAALAACGSAPGRDTPRITAPTLVADGAENTIDPQANDHVLAGLISGVQLKFYPDAGHAFLFQDWDGFASAVNAFLG
jgi:pimeloyl-ACP methyl ester carboxylesterase